MLVRKDQKRHSGKQFFAQKLLQVIFDFLDAHLVGGIDHVNKCIGLIVVIAPVWSDLTLATDVPDVKLKTILRLFQIERFVRVSLFFVMKANIVLEIVEWRISVSHLQET